MKRSFLYLTLLMTVLAVEQISAQSDLQIFGSFTGRLVKQDGLMEMNAPIGPAGSMVKLSSSKADYIGSNIGQLNLFFRKELSSNVTAWVNFEATGSYSSGSTSKTNIEHGKFSLEEAWVYYEVGAAFKIKAGLLIPRFTYMNEIKNRISLLPYSLRPAIYETQLSSTIPPSPFLPEKAFLQITGDLPTGDVNFSYALFVGNSEKSYYSQGVQGGMDTVNFKAFGGRVQASYGDLRVGAFFSSDKENHQKQFKEDVPRTRIGFDLGYTLAGFFFEGEYMKVSLAAQKTTLDLNKGFYYGTLGYNFSEELYTYGMISQVKNKEVQFMAEGMNSLAIGIGYKPLSSIVIKAEYGSYSLPDGAKFDILMGPKVVPASVNLNYKIYSLEVSLIF